MTGAGGPVPATGWTRQYPAALRSASRAGGQPVSRSPVYPAGIPSINSRPPPAATSYRLTGCTAAGPATAPAPMPDRLLRNWQMTVLPVYIPVCAGVSGP